MKLFLVNKKAQVWIETVIYTLIGLAIMGILLSIIIPSINSKKDEIIIKQSLDILKNIENKMNEVVYYGSGNSREMEIKIKKGQLIFNFNEDYIEFNIESENKYSEIGEEIKDGNVNISTIKNGNLYEVKLKLFLENINLTFSEDQSEKVFQASESSYYILITNKGSENNKIIIEIN